MSKPVTRATFDEVMVPNYAPAEMIPERGEGTSVWDKEGKHYVDLSGGIAVTGLGHCHPELVKVLKEQSEKLWHLSNVWTNEPALELAEKLTDLTFADKVFFANSGGEANEAAFKLARKYGHDHHGEECHEIISFFNGFHGRTLFTVSVGGQEKYTQGFEPLPGGITHLPYNDLETLAAHISDKTCAVVMEPMMGEGGIIRPSQSFVEGVRELCDKHDALLIFDEVQTGVGRTGHLYAYMAFGVVPDILTTAKALGGGFPVGAMLTTSRVAGSMGIGTHGSTYGGNPLACAVASKVIDIVSDQALLDSIEGKHNLLKEKLMEINNKYPVFEEVRGMGLLMGAALKEQFHGKAKAFHLAGLRHGVMVLVAGLNVVRLAPSLLITDEEINEGMARFEKAVAEIYEAGDA